MKFIPSSVTRTAAMTVLKTRKGSPKLLFVAGTVGVVATAIAASKATMRAGEILDERDKMLAQIEEAKRTASVYTDRDEKKDKAHVLVKTTGAFIKLYGPTIVIGSFTIAAFTGSHVILSRRNAGLTAAYGVLDKAFTDYRKRVFDELGEDREREIYLGTKPTEIIEAGKNGDVIKTINRADAQSTTAYAKWFDATCPDWEPEVSLNLQFLQANQSHWNYQLNSKGFVILNDVYQSQGLPKTTAGAVVGWVKDSKNGDGHVDFNIFDADKPGRLHDNIVGKDGSIMLDYNVDGIIYDQLDDLR